MMACSSRTSGWGKREIPPIRTYKFISPGFFQAIGTPLIAGRDLTWTDLYERRPVALISANLAREICGTPAAALGKRVRECTTNPWREIVGVVGDVYDDGVHVAAPAVVYWPALMENFYRDKLFAQRAVTFVVRSSRTGTDGFLADVRKAVWSVDRQPAARGRPHARRRVQDCRWPARRSRC